MKVWQATTGAPIRTLSIPLSSWISSLACTADGSLLAWYSKTALLLLCATVMCLFCLPVWFMQIVLYFVTSYFTPSPTDESIVLQWLL